MISQNTNRARAQASPVTPLTVDPEAGTLTTSSVSAVRAPEPREKGDTARDQTDESYVQSSRPSRRINQSRYLPGATLIGKKSYSRSRETTVMRRFLNGMQRKL